MKSKNKKFFNYIYLFGALIILAGSIYECNDEKNAKRESFHGVWLFKHQDQVLLTLSSIRSNKGFNETWYIRLINPITGKIEHAASLSPKYIESIELLCCTKNSLWLTYRDKFNRYDFPSLKNRWDNQQFYEEISKKHPEVGKIYSCKFAGDHFAVTNDQGKSFLIEVAEFDEPKSSIIYFFDDYLQLGKTTRYSTPETKFIENEGITIDMEEVDQQKKYHWERMNIHEKLLADTGFALHYAVYTPDSNCYYFDGNHSRICRKLVNDSLELIWTPCFNNREWLEGDFLRPYKSNNHLPDNRMITTSKNIAFVHYWTSLDEKVNHLKLAGVDITTEKLIWDIDLTSQKIKHGCKPQQTQVLDNILIILWMDGSYQGTLTGIDVNTGEVKWVVRK